MFTQVEEKGFCLLSTVFVEKINTLRLLQMAKALDPKEKKPIKFFTM